MNSSKKVYGLILPNKEQKPLVSATSVFGADDDDNDGEEVQPMPRTVKSNSQKSFLKKQVKLDIEKVLADDPKAFEYDDVYDDIQAKKMERNAIGRSNIERKPKFIHGLLKAAEQRKKEDERRIERSVQKEREAEKGLYDDKEAFVTESFRQKMKEMKEAEEQERKKQEMEEKHDVTKNADYIGFYRTILNTQVGENKKQNEQPKDLKDEKNQKKNKTTHSQSDSESEDDRKSARSEDRRGADRAPRKPLDRKDKGSTTHPGRYREESERNYEKPDRKDRLNDERVHRERESERSQKYNHRQKEIDRHREGRGRDKEQVMKKKRQDSSSSSSDSDNEHKKSKKQRTDGRRKEYDYEEKGITTKSMYRSERSKDSSRHRGESNRNYEENNQGDRRKDERKHIEREAEISRKYDDRQKEIDRRDEGLKMKSKNKIAGVSRNQAEETESTLASPKHTGDTDDAMSESSSSSSEDEMKLERVKVPSTSQPAVKKSPSDARKELFAKKTTGDALTDARARYLARKGSMSVAIIQDD